MPETPAPRRPFRWKIAGLTLVALSLLWGGAAFGIGKLAESRWAAMKTRWQELLEEARSRGRSRPPLRGEPAAGNAWDEYSVAIRETRTLYDLESQAAPTYLESGSGADRILVEQVLARHPSLIDAVRRGAGRSDASLGLEWKEGALVVPSRHGSATVARLAVCKARLLVERGRTRDAIELLLDACRFAGDLDHPEDMEPEFRELNALMQAGRLTGPELEQIDRELDILDRGFPRRGHRVLLDFVSLGSLFIRSGGSITPQLVGIGADPDDGLWRYGFSGRLMKTSAFGALLEAVQQLNEADDRPWLESKDLFRRIATELGAHANPLVRSAAEEVLRSDLLHRGHRAQLRLVRTAARFYASGEILALADPFGDQLKSRKADDALKLWSVGPEGRDHGGLGTYAFDAEGRDDKDLLLEVRR